MADYLIHLLVMIGIYSILAYSMNLVTGYGGLLTFCLAAFYGIGAYTTRCSRSVVETAAFRRRCSFLSPCRFQWPFWGPQLRAALLRWSLDWFRFGSVAISSFLPHSVSR